MCVTQSGVQVLDPDSEAAVFTGTPSDLWRPSGFSTTTTPAVTVVFGCELLSVSAGQWCKTKPRRSFAAATEENLKEVFIQPSDLHRLQLCVISSQFPMNPLALHIT